MIVGKKFGRDIGRQTFLNDSMFHLPVLTTSYLVAPTLTKAVKPESKNEREFLLHDTLIIKPPILHAPTQTYSACYRQVSELSTNLDTVP